MDGIVSVALTSDVQSFITGFRSATREAQKAEGLISKSTKGISNAVTSNLTGIFSVAAIAGFTREVIKVTAEFEKFQAVLGNTLGSQALADLKLKEIQEFAARTPFAVNELTGAFVKLANGGFKPTGEQLTNLGDLASSTGKSFDQLAEAILDAQTGEFERLKEFGIRAKDAGDSVIFTYKGVQTQVEKTSDAIRNYITNLGGAEGVSGSMAKISQTLGGQISNLGDNWDQMLLSVGSNTTGVFNSAISVMSKAIQKITQYNEDLKIASEFKVGDSTKDFFQRLNRGINPFASKGATELELATAGVKEANKNVGEFVSKALAGAKSAADFGKALAGLKQQGDKALKSFGIVNEGERAGISAAYQKGVQAIQDARNNLSNEPVGNANFGKGTEKKVKTLSDVLQKLAEDLRVVNIEFAYAFKDNPKIDAYQKAIEELVRMGYDPASAAVKRLREEQQNLFQLTELPGAPSANTGLKSPLTSDGKTTVGIQKPDLGLGFSELEKEQARIIEKQLKFNEDFNNIVTDGLVGGISGIGQALGEALANGGNVFEALGKSLLSSLGGVLTQLGEMAIGVGIGLTAIKAALKSLNPVVAIAAGVALIALGSLVSSKAGAIGGKIQGGGGNAPTAFANGGIVSGPTLGLMGEYAGAKNNPEVIAPLDKLKSMLGQDEKGLARKAQQSQNTVILQPSLEVNADKFLVTLKRAEEDKRRT